MLREAVSHRPARPQWVLTHAYRANQRRRAGLRRRDYSPDVLRITDAFGVPVQMVL